MTEPAKITTDALFAAAECEMREALQLPEGDLDAVDRLRLSAATGLRMELNRLEGIQRGGGGVDIAALVRASDTLRGMFLTASVSTSEYDLTALSDAEFEMLSKLLHKAAG